MKQLVVNGCSYAEVYASGGGHTALAKQLGMTDAVSLAIGGSANSRIIRTTAKHAYTNKQPSLYIIHLTFMSRWEIPVATSHRHFNMDFEGRWINPQKQGLYTPSWQWNDQDTTLLTELNFKSVIDADKDLFEDMVYRCLSLMALVKSHGHKILFINQCDSTIKNVAETADFDFLDNHKEFVERLVWISNLWQHSQGVPESIYGSGTMSPPPEHRHRMPGQHLLVNDYLSNYIKQNKILE